MYRDPVFNNSLTRDALELDMYRKKTFEKVSKSLRYFLKEGDEERAKNRSWIFDLLEPSQETRIGVHYYLFRPAIENTGTPEQVLKYAIDATMSRISGCFAMTELGHGSNVPGLETTATYDKQRQEFAINTPTITATKWWIGGAADTATHCVCFAQLIVDGVKHGVNMFVIQLRDMDTHDVLPGITIGDCGKKMGRNGIDNGWIQFTNVRIPRTDMLMRFVEVKPDGQVIKRGSQQNAYSALIGGRVAMVSRSSNVLKLSLIKAIRYAAIRRQFNEKDGEPEIPILNYATHEYRLMPLLAGAYAIHFAAEKLEYLFKDAQIEAEKGNFSAYKDAHTISAGLKPFCTWLAHYGIDECRQACGGHGYSSISGFSESFNDFAVMCTWEGDNTVLSQQMARDLVNGLRAMMSGKELAQSMRYLKYIPKALGSQCQWNSEEDFLNIKEQFKVWSYIPMKLLVDAAQTLQARIKSGLSEKEAWNKTAVDLIRATKAHTYLILIGTFIEKVSSVNDERLKKSLKLLSDLFCLYHMEQNMATLLEDGYFNSQQAKILRSLVQKLTHEVRKSSILYTDAFGYPDFIIQSPLGRYDGNMYEHYFSIVQSKYPPNRKIPYYKETIKPLLKNKMEDNEIVKAKKRELMSKL